MRKRFIVHGIKHQIFYTLLRAEMERYKLSVSREGFFLEAVLMVFAVNNPKMVGFKFTLSLCYNLIWKGGSYLREGRHETGNTGWFAV